MKKTRKWYHNWTNVSYFLQIIILSNFQDKYQTRTTTPEYYQANPESLERLKPWLKREIVAAASNLVIEKNKPSRNKQKLSRLIDEIIDSK